MTTGTGDGAAGSGPGRIAERIANLALIAFAEIFKILPRRSR